MALRCIHTAILGALLLAPAAACAGPACAVDTAQLVAAWESDGEGDFEQFELSRRDGRNGFDSWLHERPEMLGGTWRFDPKTCRLRIDHAATGQHWQYAVDMTDAKTLLLRAPDERRSARYRKIANGR
ncbi:hypothetical protein LVB77_17205 [Lysobacter sp. 5GHs7-4]|uniref:hypothetical protein n=1 Tax=Lysobacter sp. 5GHs7-4 TaxID=2904253 RepID=UPI001E28A703|nr:hypothetical protein [Lysobacter sp. 5GHs7-4]UHQ22385.1 hypothetical protein LVB77_17205 [Lysobacter sp. 5GHs7-4]